MDFFDVEWEWDFGIKHSHAQPEIAKPILADNTAFEPPDIDWTATYGQTTCATWSDNPFDAHVTPIGELLEPSGHETMQRLNVRGVKQYARHMPQTVALASTIYDAVADKRVWGVHLATPRPYGRDEFGRSNQDAAWKTITAGRWIAVRQGGRRFPQKPLALLDVIKTLADRNHYSIGNRDMWSFHGDLLHVRQVRIDIDLDSVFNERELDPLRGEVHIAANVFGAFGLAASVMRTGNRGIQIIAPTPPLSRSAAGVLVHAIRYVLSRVPRTWRAKDFQSNLDGVLRLPLGRHAYTSSVAAMLDTSTALLLPLDQQAHAVQCAFGANPTLNLDWVSEIEHYLKSCGISRSANIPLTTMPRIVADLPDNPLVVMRRHACEQFGVEVAPIWQESAEHACAQDSAEQSAHAINNATSAEASSDVPNIVKLVPVNKARAWAVLNAGFAPGESYHYYMNKVVRGIHGKNALGCALIVFDGDVGRAQEWLERQAQDIPAVSPGAVADRIRLIRGYLPGNDTYTRLQQYLERRKHRELIGNVLGAESDLAQAVVKRLPELRRASACRTKQWSPKALTTIKHIVEVALLAYRESEDGIIHLSSRTIDAAIRERWPTDATNHVDVSRQMEWIVRGEKCLFEVLVKSEDNRQSRESWAYRLGEDIIGLVNAEQKKED